jgi:hypothetical protein
VALAVLLPGVGSTWSESEIAAVLVSGSGETTVACSCSVCGVPTATVPTVHNPAVESYVPWLGDADTNVNPAGNRSVTPTPFAGSGPLFVNITVNVT